MARFNPLNHPICLAYPQWIAPSEWIEHVPFAMYIVDLLRPRVLVELGTHYGVSYCAFCQAVAELQLPTRCYAVDTWQGDPHDGFYGSEVLDALAAHHQPLYGGFSRLLQQTFDEAVSYFEDGSIDLLHIDGYHTYDAVKHDFETWRPKLSNRAVVLFHDVNVRERDFGAWRVWEELSRQYPHFAFAHGHGLGVLAVGPDYPPALAELTDADPEEKQQIQQLFYQLGLRLRMHQQRDRLKQDLTSRLDQKEQLLQKANSDIETLTGWVRERDQLLRKAQDDIQKFQGWISERDVHIQALQASIAHQQDDITTLHAWIAERDERIRKSDADFKTLEGWVRERDALLQQAQSEAHALHDQVQRLEQQAQHLRDAAAQAEARAAQAEARAVQAEARANQVYGDLQQIHSSLGWKLVHPMWKLRQRILPSHGRAARNIRRGRNAMRIVRHEGMRGLARHTRGWIRYRRGRAPHSVADTASSSESDGDAYALWIAQNEPDSAALQRQRLAIHLLAYQSLISIVTPVYNPPPDVLAAMIDSIVAQTYGYWELILVNGSPDNQPVAEVLQRYSTRDARIRVLSLAENRGIVGNTNAGLDEAQGVFTAFVDHDDTLAPFALFEVVQLLNEQPETDLIYSDSDLLSFDGSRRFQPLFKPDWSPAIMLSANYATHLCVVRTDVLCAVGGLAEGTDGAQDWDLILRISEHTQRIAHVPRVLYHWRESPVSTAIDISRKPYALQVQLDVIKRHLARTGLEAEVFLDATGYIRATWPPAHDTLVSIIVPSRNLTLVRRCIDSIYAHTSYRRYEIIIIDTTSDGAITSYYGDVQRGQVKVVRFSAPFNYSAVNNLAATHARGNALLFLNDDTEAFDEGWLTELVRWVERDSVGVVGAKLLREDGCIQHAGVVIGLGGFADHPFAGGPEGQRTIYGNTEWYRNFSAVTGACLMIRRALFEQVGGFDEQLVLCGNDVELCLRVGRLGYQIVYTPFARLRHLESVTRGTTIPREDFLHSFLHYRPLLAHGDPFYNPNLSAWATLPRLRQPDEEAPLEFVERYLSQLGLEAPAADEQAPVKQGTLLG